MPLGALWTFAICHRPHDALAPLVVEHTERTGSLKGARGAFEMFEAEPHATGTAGLVQDAMHDLHILAPPSTSLRV